MIYHCYQFPDKRQYASKAVAKQAKRNMRGASKRDDIQPYLCKGCASWHLGHKRKPKERLPDDAFKTEIELHNENSGGMG